jgi:protease-4
MVDSIYSTFVKRVDEGRALSYTEIDAIGQGRIWSGIDAVELGLVDKFGGLTDAIEIAKNMAGLSDKYRIVELPAQEDPLTKIIKEITGEASLKSIEKKLGSDAEYFMIVKKLISNHGIMTRMPFDISME